MSNVTVDRLGEFRRLRAAYDARFQQWVAEVRLWEALRLVPHHDRAAVEEARGRVERAQNSYREIRNRLAEFVLTAPEKAAPWPTSAVSPKDLGSSEDRRRQALQVQELAQSLWEEAGKPDGTADADWRRAELILQTSDPSPATDS